MATGDATAPVDAGSSPGLPASRSRSRDVAAGPRRAANALASGRRHAARPGRPGAGRLSSSALRKYRQGTRSVPGSLLGSLARALRVQAARLTALAERLERVWRD